MQSVPITNKVVSLNPAHGEVYSIHYVIKFISDFRQVVGFLCVLPVSSTNKSDRHNITDILLKVALNTITLTLISFFKFYKTKINLAFIYSYVAPLSGAHVFTPVFSGVRVT